MPGAALRSDDIFQMSLKTLPISMSLHVDNRSRLIKALKKNDLFKPKSAILLQGGSEKTFGSADVNYLFRQESYFNWAFGVLEPDFYGVIDIDKNETTLFLPKHPESYEIIFGKVQSNEEFARKYAVNSVRYNSELLEFFTSNNFSEILLLNGLNTDSGLKTEMAYFDGIKNFILNETSLLFQAITECRLIKSATELDIIRYCNKISSAAHRYLMRHVEPGMYEYQAESLFLHYCYTLGGMRHVSYTCIGASGCNCSVLHYGHAGAPNERQIKEGDMCLFDMGGEYYCYASDITCSYPVTGKFTEDQKMIYNAVLKSNRAVLGQIRAGVQWRDLHILAESVILTELVEGGVLRGKDKVEEMIEKGIGGIFMPHGMGHLLGVDVHDVGGYEGDSLPRATRLGLKSLRTCRILAENMTLTVEPGCYFITSLLQQALKDDDIKDFFNEGVLRRFWGFGGVRIEDNIIVKRDGVELMTNVPRTVEEIEEWMTKGGKEDMEEAFLKEDGLDFVAQNFSL